LSKQKTIKLYGAADVGYGLQCYFNFKEAAPSL